MFKNTKRNRNRTAEQIHRQQRSRVERSAQDLRDPMTSMLMRVMH